jgi:hypothetical protein
VEIDLYSFWVEAAQKLGRYGRGVEQEYDEYRCSRDEGACAHSWVQRSRNQRTRQPQEQGVELKTSEVFGYFLHGFVRGYLYGIAICIAVIMYTLAQ